MKKIEDLIFYRGWISESGYITPDLKYQFVQKNKGVLQLNLVIDDHVSIDMLINNFSKIKEVRKVLIDFRGNNYNLFENSLTHQLLEIKNKYSKRPYKTIQFEMNFNLIMYCFALTEDPDQIKILEINKKAVDYYFRSTLKYFNFSSDEINYYLKEFGEFRKENTSKLTGLSNGLIEVNHIRAKLYYQQKLNFKLNIDNSGLYYFNKLHYMLLVSGYFHKTINFLESNYPKEMAIYKQRADARFEELNSFPSH